MLTLHPPVHLSTPSPQRPSMDEALQHRWFREPPLPTLPALMPFFGPRKAG